jgi:hypothetical protein
MQMFACTPQCNRHTGHTYLPRLACCGVGSIVCHDALWCRTGSDMDGETASGICPNCGDSVDLVVTTPSKDSSILIIANCVQPQVTPSIANVKRVFTRV